MTVVNNVETRESQLKFRGLQENGFYDVDPNNS